MKKILSVLLAIFIMFTMTACEGNERAGVLPAVDITAATAGPDAGTAGAAGDAGVSGASGASDINADILDMGKEDNTRITVAIGSPGDRYMETAAKRFQDENPGIVVELKYYTSMGETMTQQTEDGGTLVISENTDPGGEKYVKTLNTELMSGAGPDIIDTFNVPCGKFADNGFLCDLLPIIRQDAGFDKSIYYESIMDGVKYKDGLYTMPVGFTIDLLSAVYELPKEAVSNGLTLDAFFSLAGGVLKANGVSGTYVLYDSEETLFRNMLKRYYGDFVNEDSRECDFTSGKFVNLIECIKRAMDNKLLYRSDKHSRSDKGWEDLFFLMEYRYESNYLAAYKDPVKNNLIYAIPSMSGESAVFANIHKAYGINSNSKSKGAAWKFIKFLISEQMQTSPEFFLFPVNKAAMAQKIEREKDDGMNMELTANDPVFSEISVYANQDNQITVIILEETMKYFDGQRTAEETARILQSRVDLMVKE